jgi:hypothetical protein
MDALRDMGEDDAVVLGTAVEGETSLHEALNYGLYELGEVEALDASLKQRAEQIAQRRARLQAKAQRIRGSLLAALETSGVPLPVRLPEATVGTSHSARGVHLYDIDAVPSEFITESVVKHPDMRAIKDALERGEPVPGAQLRNGELRIAIRRS